MHLVVRVQRENWWDCCRGGRIVARLRRRCRFVLRLGGFDDLPALLLMLLLMTAGRIDLELDRLGSPIERL